MVQIRWLAAKDIEKLVMLGGEEEWLIDYFEIEKIHARFPHLCYAAYDESELIGAITCYLHELSGWLGNFIVKSGYRKQGIGKRLFETALKAVLAERKSVYLNAAPSMVNFYSGYGFKEAALIGRYLNVGKAPPFSFFSQHARELQESCFDAVSAHLDKEVFGEDRHSFLREDMPHKSSLKFATENGFSHSRIVNSRYVFIGPWEVKAGAYTDAEKMMRGTLYYRGLKKLFADVPSGVNEITELYREYKFEKVSETVQMCLGTPLPMVYEDIYAFATTGVCG